MFKAKTHFILISFFWKHDNIFYFFSCLCGPHGHTHTTGVYGKSLSKGHVSLFPGDRAPSKTESEQFCVCFMPLIQLLPAAQGLSVIRMSPFDLSSSRNAVLTLPKFVFLVFSLSDGINHSWRRTHRLKVTEKAADIFTQGCIFQFFQLLIEM